MTSNTLKSNFQIYDSIFHDQKFVHLPIKNENADLYVLIYKENVGL